MVRRSSARSLGSELLLDFGGQVVRKAGDKLLDFFGDVYGGASDRTIGGLSKTVQDTNPTDKFFTKGLNPQTGQVEEGYGRWRQKEGREAVRGQPRPSFDEQSGKYEAWYKRNC